MVKLQNCKGAKHQNTTAFECGRYNKTPSQKIAESVSTTCFCKKCKAVVDWKIKFGKYKPLTTMRKCDECQEKKINAAYHRICVDCSQMRRCPKCGDNLNQE